ncbi:phage tail tube protein [Saccharopolyspora shandongensis]|uniref:phage tail tube protein n=1 Tax=Saccharopolyspora shandongensis TaxID=418495 RepID=UPI0033D4F4B8
MRSLLAKDWRLEVNTAGIDADCPVWVPVHGLTSFTETQDNNTEDDSDFDSGGWGSDVVTQRKWSIEAEGKRKRKDKQRFEPDPGQEFIRRSARLIGFDATIEVRWYRRDGSPDAHRGYCTVSEFEKGGEVTDLEPFTFTLAGQGEPVEIINPWDPPEPLPVPYDEAESDSGEVFG